MIIGNGKETKVWQDRWIGREPAMMATAMRRVEGGTQWRVLEDMRVSELICVNGRDWNQEALHRLFVDEVSDKIKRIRPAGLQSEDTYSCTL